MTVPELERFLGKKSVALWGGGDAFPDEHSMTPSKELTFAGGPPTQPTIGSIPRKGGKRNDQFL